MFHLQGSARFKLPGIKESATTCKAQASLDQQALFYRYDSYFLR
jgi:hypothetical protein